MKRQTLECNTIDYYILPNKILCNIVGIWPIEEKKSIMMKKSFAYFRVFFALTAVSSVLVPEILAIIMNWGDIEVLTGVGCVSTTVGQLLFKMIYLLARRKISLKLYKDIRNCWYMSNDTNNRKCYEDLAGKARILTMGFLFSGICNVMTFTIVAVIIRIKEGHSKGNQTEMIYHMPFEVWYGPKALQSPSFEIAFICQILASVICCAGIIGLDATMMTLILHICGQFKLIQAWFRSIGRNVGQALIKDNTISVKLKCQIKKSIEHHQRMIIVVKETNDLISPIIFVQLLTSGLEICLSGYSVMYGASGLDLIKFISYLCSMMIQLLIWCWPAELLVQESIKIADSIYFDIPWYNLPTTYRKDLCLIIIRAQTYCCVNAAIFKVLSLQTLTKVFNTAASYFTLLKEM
ncbi:odorant receptor 22c-like [Vespa velutina]|uniref:odorant receptor 22c-like n=1 Tax=Vespa velutina TaxID=202808 RepID=UPI001FB2C16C|nr:odorant receptor 22c-like [Vespa velutina]